MINRTRLFVQQATLAITLLSMPLGAQEEVVEQIEHKSYCMMAKKAAIYVLAVPPSIACTIPALQLVDIMAEQMPILRWKPPYQVAVCSANLLLNFKWLATTLELIIGGIASGSYKENLCKNALIGSVVIFSSLPNAILELRLSNGDTPLAIGVFIAGFLENALGSKVFIDDFCIPFGNKIRRSVQQFTSIEDDIEQQAISTETSEKPAKLLTAIQNLHQGAKGIYLIAGEIGIIYLLSSYAKLLAEDIERLSSGKGFSEEVTPSAVSWLAVIAPFIPKIALASDLIWKNANLCLGPYPTEVECPSQRRVLLSMAYILIHSAAYFATVPAVALVKIGNLPANDAVLPLVIISACMMNAAPFLAGLR